MLPEVTVAIPTYNRAGLLRETLASALSQDYPNFQVLVVDNASTDDTQVVVKSFADPRIRYCRNAANIGMVPNLNRAIRLNQSPYLTILLDDDLMAPGFLRQTVELLDRHPNAGFALVRARYIDSNGALLDLADGDLISLGLPTGVISGLEYLHLSAGTRRGGNPSTAVFRASALASVGGFDSPHCKHTTELNLYLRLASRFDVALTAEELAHIRLHPDQASNLEWRADRVGYIGEYIDVIAHLLRSERAADAGYREWLSERLMRLNARQSELLAGLAPGVYWSWTERLETAMRELAEAVPAGAAYILADQDQFGDAADLPGRRRLPFLEKDGQYWGAPADDNDAIRELERMREAGAGYLAIAWPAFCWLDQYPVWAAGLNRRFFRVLGSSRLIVFDLRDCGA